MTRQTPTIEPAQNEPAGQPKGAPNLKRAREVLDLWWIGKGGQLESVHHLGGGGGGESGCDYPSVVYIHVERFFTGPRRKWRGVADFGCRNGGSMETYPEWRLTPPCLFELGAGQLIGLPPKLAAARLYTALLVGLARWLEKNPAPKMPAEFLEVV